MTIQDDWQNINCDQPLRGGPVDRGFDAFFGMYASLDIPPYFYIENDRCLTPPTGSIGDHQSKEATSTISGAFWRKGKIAPSFRHVEVLPTFTSKALALCQRKRPLSSAIKNKILMK